MLLMPTYTEDKNQTQARACPVNMNGNVICIFRQVSLNGIVSDMLLKHPSVWRGHVDVAQLTQPDNICTTRDVDLWQSQRQHAKGSKE